MAEATSLAVKVTPRKTLQHEESVCAPAVDQSSRKSPRSAKSKAAADKASPATSATHKRELLLPMIESAPRAQISSNARRITNIFTKTIFGKVGTAKPGDATALGAYASMFGNKLRRRHSLSQSHGSQTLRTIELPTYRLEPLAKQTVRWARLQIMVDSILTDFINRGRYDKSTVSTSAKRISQNIKFLTKELGFSKRYKIITTVEIGQNFGQDYKSCSRCLWNTDLDGSVTSYKKSPVVFIVASLYLIYTD